MGNSRNQVNQVPSPISPDQDHLFQQIYHCLTKFKGLKGVGSKQPNNQFYRNGNITTPLFFNNQVADEQVFFDHCDDIGCFMQLEALLYPDPATPQSASKRMLSTKDKIRIEELLYQLMLRLVAQLKEKRVVGCSALDEINTHQNTTSAAKPSKWYRVVTAWVFNVFNVIMSFIGGMLSGEALLLLVVGLVTHSVVPTVILWVSATVAGLVRAAISYAYQAPQIKRAVGLPKTESLTAQYVGLLKRTIKTVACLNKVYNTQQEMQQKNPRISSCFSINDIRFLEQVKLWLQHRKTAHAQLYQEPWLHRIMRYGVIVLGCVLAVGSGAFFWKSFLTAALGAACFFSPAGLLIALAVGIFDCLFYYLIRQISIKNLFNPKEQPLVDLDKKLKACPEQKTPGLTVYNRHSSPSPTNQVTMSHQYLPNMPLTLNNRQQQSQVSNGSKFFDCRQTDVKPSNVSLTPQPRRASFSG